MTIQLPPLPLGSSTEITYLSSSVDQKPYMGGAVQRLSRMGDRWQIKVDCRPMHSSQAGYITTTLVQGLNDKILVDVPQPGINLSRYSNGSVAAPATNGGRVIQHNDGGATKVVGQYLSIIISGVRYLHQITGVSGSSLTIIPMLKKPLSGGETIEFGAPKLEGLISGSSQNWTIGLATTVGLTFTVIEAQ